MARHRQRNHTSNLRCQALEPRENPAGRVLDFGDGFPTLGVLGAMPTTSDGHLLLTDGPFQARALQAPTAVDLRAFETSFVFRQEGEPGRMGDGFTFFLSGSIVGEAGAAGGGLGYQGLTDSVAIKFDLVDNAGEGLESVGVFTGGAAPTTPAEPAGALVRLAGGDVFRARLTYAGGVLHVELRDTKTGAEFARDYAVDIPAAVGGPTAYVGFTAGTGALYGRIDVLDWAFGSPAAG